MFDTTNTQRSDLQLNSRLLYPAKTYVHAH